MEMHVILFETETKSWY